MTIQRRHWRQESTHVGGQAFSLLELLGRESWMDEGLCRETDPESFYPAKGVPNRPAKRICQACPVRAECLEYALSHDEHFGIWGGLSETERRRVKRGQPAKTAQCAEADQRALMAQAMAAEGADVQWISEALGISPFTVRKALRRPVGDAA